jgi:transcriptional regulator with XRE-family HTH domain
MSHLTSIKLNLAEKLKDKEYRKRFFRGQAEDEIAISIRSLREKREKRQVDLATESGMKQSAISRIEQADYCGWSLKTLFRIADALDARLRVVFDPVEFVIEQYKEIESNISQEDQCIELHEASEGTGNIPEKESWDTPDRRDLSNGLSIFS